jgi:hypothetical protein
LSNSDKEIDVSELRLTAANNQRLTKGLFYEMAYPNHLLAPYTLRDQDYEKDGKVYLSFKKLYLACLDPTEYLFATKYLINWGHWENLSTLSWFVPYITEWRKELDLLLRAQSLARIIRESRVASRDSFAANKYLLEKGWDEKGKRGRPSKDEIRQRADALFETNSKLDSDFQRLGIAVN